MEKGSRWPHEDVLCYFIYLVLFVKHEKMLKKDTNKCSRGF